MTDIADRGGENPVVEIEDEPDAPDVGNRPGETLMLGPLLRHVDDTSATVWVEVARPATVEVLGHRTATFTVENRHYALVVVEGLAPGSTTPYEVAVDGRKVWPDPSSTFPPSLIRTSHPGLEPVILLGSCRAAAPHHPPYSLERTTDHEARGVDALWAHAHRMKEQSPDDWPDLVVMMGDQIYADDSSPAARERIEQLRTEQTELPPSVVLTYEEYCLLYQEAWQQEAERWLLSTVPSAMIFDDHDMIDDWNISASWLEEIRSEPWWQEHAVAGYVSYLVYQHLGNLSPTRLREEGLLAAAIEAGDATALLREWAVEVERTSAIAGGYRFSHARTIGGATVVVVDCRNARVLDGTERRMVDPEEWAWVRQQCLAANGHLVVATTVPVFIADGLHDLMVWNEQICHGRWGPFAARLGEKLRRALDLEDWSAFAASYADMVELVDDLRDGAARSVVIASGDIHFSYAAEVPGRTGRKTPVWQVVSSPIRNALIPHERGVMRFTLTAAGRYLGAALRRGAGVADTRPAIEMAAGPYFANAMTLLRYDTDEVEVVIEQATQDADGPSRLDEVASLTISVGQR